VIDVERRIRELLPAAEVQLSGSASLPGLDPGYADEWREDWTAFRVPGTPQVDVVVTRPGTLGDKHHRLAWHLLAERPDLLEEYRALKATPGDYEARKREFFERVVAQL
jgi:hypothetical protein